MAQKAIQTQFTIPGRTVHNLSHVVKFDARPGVIYPVTHIPLLPVDRIESSIRSLVLTFPTKNPMLSNFQARIYAFYVPYSLYVPALKANARLHPYGSSPMNDAPEGGIETMYINQTNWANVMFPYWLPSSSIGAVQPHCLLDWIGVPVGFRPYDTVYDNSETSLNPTGYISALRILAYYDIFRNYFANPMEEYFPMYVGTGTASAPTTEWAWKDLETLNRWYAAKPWYTNTSPSTQNINISSSPLYNMFGVSYASYSGMCVKTFTRDMNNVFLSNGLYGNAIATSILDVSTGQLDLNQLAVGQRLYQYFTKVAATGGRFDEFARAEWGVDLRGELDIPMFLRSYSFDIGFDTVVSTAATDAQALGSLAGRGIGGIKPRSKRDRSTQLNFSSKQYGELIFMFTIEPKNDYYQGIDPFLCKNWLGDLHTPSLDRLGWQPLYLAQINALNTANRNTDDNGWATDSNPFDIVIGRQPAWTEYKSMVNRLHGDLAVSGNSLHNWVLSRNYEEDSFDGGQDAYISYIDPASYVDMFADTSTASDPFVVQIAFDVTAKRPVSNANIHVF